MKRPTKEKIARANLTADLIEFRLDLFEPEERLQLDKFRAQCQIPVIFTCKSFSKDTIFSFLKLRPEYVDLDVSYPKEVFHEITLQYPEIKKIASQHGEKKDFPFVELLSFPADIFKGVFPAAKTTDALEMLTFTKKTKVPFIGICTGHFGTITRILSSIVGAPFTYAPLSEEDITAEGQILLDELLSIYHFKECSKKTSLYGLIGDPVVQSPGHLIHNLAFLQLGLDALYLKMRVSKEEIPYFLKLAKQLNFKGFSVTIPLKTDVIKNAVINTVKIQGRKVVGFNTDGPAALDLIERRKKVEGLHILILGNGGSALGIGEEAIKRGAKVTFLYRTAKNHPLLQGRALPLSMFPLQEYDILINCTPKQDIICYDQLLEKKIVMDITLAPLPSALLSAAQEKECIIIDGMELFLKQAAYQYEHWFCHTPL